MFSKGPSNKSESRSIRKKMITSFFRKTSYITYIAFENHRTINVEWYTTICLPIVIWKNSSKSAMIAHHLYQDNASSLNAEKTTQFSATIRVQLMWFIHLIVRSGTLWFLSVPYIKDKMRSLKFNTSGACMWSWLRIFRIL